MPITWSPMPSNQKISLSVPHIAGKAVSEKGYVTAVDVFLGLGWLSQSNFRAWKQRQVGSLEQVIGANLSKISTAMKAFRAWAEHSKLKPRQSAYRHKGFDLQFSKSGIPSIETAYKTHFVLIKSDTSKMNASELADDKVT